MEQNFIITAKRWVERGMLDRLPKVIVVDREGSERHNAASAVVYYLARIDSENPKISKPAREGLAELVRDIEFYLKQQEKIILAKSVFSRSGKGRDD